MNERTLSGRRWWKLATSPWTWGPSVIGACGWVLLSPPVGWGVGGLGLGLALLHVVWGLTMGKSRLTEAAQQDLQREAEQQHLTELRELRRKLRNDRDHRTGEAVRTLRDAYLRMQKTGIFFDVGDSQKNIPLREVKAQTIQLYQACLQSLERSWGLWNAANEMRSDENRQKLLNEREGLVVEVVTSVENLGRSLDHLQTTSLEKTLPEAKVSEARRELDQGLEVARNVQDRLEQLEHDLKIPE